jgi:hypothetical protein
MSKKVVGGSESRPDREAFVMFSYMSYDIKYLFREGVVKVFLEETTVLEDLLEIANFLTFKDEEQ